MDTGWYGQRPVGGLAKPPGQMLTEAYMTFPEWLWAGRIPERHITILDGDPGLGKTLVALDIAARLTAAKPMPFPPAGEWWGENASLEAGVVYFTAEDDPGITLKPRFLAAGGDPSKFLAVTTISEWTAEGGTRDRLPTFRDLDIIKRAVDRVEASLVIFDPFAAYMGSGGNSWRDQDVREVLAPLAEMLHHEFFSVLILRHLNKSAGMSALYRGGGSIGIIGQARSGLLIAKSPEDPEHERVLAQTKSNLGRPVPALRFRITSIEDYPEEMARVGDGAANVYAPRVEWLGECAYTATALLSHTEADPEPSATEEAVAFLRAALAEGARPAAKMHQQARALNISPAALQRARGRLSIHPDREGFGTGSRWVWALPASDTPTPATAASSDGTSDAPDDEEEEPPA